MRTCPAFLLWSAALWLACACGLGAGTFDPGGLNLMEIKPLSERGQPPADVAVAVWPSGLIDAGQTHYLTQSNATLIIVAVANPLARSLDASWAICDLPAGVELDAVNAHLVWSTRTSQSIQRDGKNYTRHKLEVSPAAYTIPSGKYQRTWYARYQPPCLWVSTELAPASSPGKAYLRLEYLKSGQGLPTLSPESWVELAVLPPLEANTPALAGSGVMGRAPLSFNDGDSAAEALVASYTKAMGCNMFMGGMAQSAAPAGLARWTEGRNSHQLGIGFRHNEDDPLKVGDGFSVDLTPAVMATRPEEIGRVDENMNHVGGGDISPWAIYRKHGWVQANVLDVMAQSVTNGDYQTLWANWEPNMSGLDYSEGSKTEFIQWSGMASSLVNSLWLDPLVAAYREEWESFRNWELGMVVTTYVEAVGLGAQQAGVDARFMISAPQDSFVVHPNHTDFPYQTLRWGDMPNYILQTWSYHNVPTSDGPFPVIDRMAYYMIQRCGWVRSYVDQQLGTNRQARLGCAYGWDQVGGRAGFFVPEDFAFRHLGTVLAGLDVALNYGEWPVWDGRYAAELARVNTRIARWEDYVLSGIKQGTHVVIPVSSYPQQVPESTVPADQRINGGWSDPGYLHSYEYEKNGSRLIAVANNWHDGECFLRLKVFSLDTGTDYVLWEPEQDRAFGNSAGGAILSAAELEAGLVVHVGATRWGAFLVEPHDGGTDYGTVLRPDEVWPAIEWTGAGDGVNWSDANNWDRLRTPVAGDDVYLGSNSTLDANFTVDSLSLTAGRTLSASGGSTLTVTNILADANWENVTLNADVVLGGDLLIEGGATGVGALRFGGAITGSDKVILGDRMAGPDGVLAVFTSGNNTFSGGLDIDQGQIQVEANDSVGTGPMTWGTGDGSGTAQIQPMTSGTYSFMPTVTAQAGTGLRAVYCQLNSGSVTFPNDWVLDKDLTITSHGVHSSAGPFGNNTTVTLSGDLSGAGGLVVKPGNAYGAEGGWSTTGNVVVLAGANTYSGRTSVSNATLTVDGSMANANMLVEGSNGTVNGSGTISYNDGELIAVSASGLLDAASLAFDLTALTHGIVTVVDYGTGSVSLPGTLDDLLTPASQAMGWSLENGGSTLVAGFGADDAYEENDDAPGAHDPGVDWTNTWLSSLSGSGLQADEDWYQIQVDAGWENLELDVDFQHASGNIDVDVRPASSPGTIECSASSTTDDEHIECELSGSGTYLVRVYGQDAGNLYDLYWGLAPPPATITWTGNGDGANWSDPDNWDLLRVPVAGDDVVVVETTMMDRDFTIGSLTMTGVGTDLFGDDSLTLTSLNKNQTGYTTVHPPIALTNDLTVIKGAGQGGITWGGTITGPHEVIADMGGEQFIINRDHTFSGGLDIVSAYLRVDNATGRAGTGSITMGAGDGSGHAGLFLYGNGTFLKFTNTVTIAAGTGNRDLITQVANFDATFPASFALQKDLVVALGSAANGVVNLTGLLSGAGGLQMGGYEDDTVILSGANTYGGSTTVSKGTLTVNGSVANADVQVGGADTATVNGSGTIAFNDGEQITVGAGGTLNAASLAFDLTGVTPGPVTLVDYSAGSVNLPATLDDLLSAASQAAGWTLTDTGSSVTATVVPFLRSSP